VSDNATAIIIAVIALILFVALRWIDAWENVKKGKNDESSER
jgi:hypothetical protein